MLRWARRRGVIGAWAGHPVSKRTIDAQQKTHRFLSAELRLRASSIVSASLMVVDVVGIEEHPSLTGELFIDAGDTFGFLHCRRFLKLVEQDTHHRC